MKTFLFAAMVALGSAAWAGQEAGNGGDVVVCTQPNGSKTYELLDLYELRENHGLTLDASAPRNLDEKGYALYQLRKLQAWSHHDNYKYRVQTVGSRLQFVNEDLVDIRDSLNTYIPSNCELKQVAINLIGGKIKV